MCSTSIDNRYGTDGSVITLTGGDSGPAPSSGVRAMMKILQSAGEVSNFI